MAEISKEPTQGETPIQGAISIFGLMIRTEGLSQTLRFLQYAVEAHAAEIAKPQNGEKTDEAARFLKAADLLEIPYIETKWTLKI